MNNAHKRLLGKPLLFAAAQAASRGNIKFLKNGTAIVRMNKTVTRKVARHEQFDLTQATIFGLNERLTLASTSPVLDARGSTLRDKFNLEWSKYMAALALANPGGMVPYGVYAYYPRRNHLVHFCDPYWHRVVSVASSSKLYADPDRRLTWVQIREIFAKTTIGVAGASVGNTILHTLVMDLRPDNIKVADKSLYKMENVNRVRLSYWDVVESEAARNNPMESLLRNKAMVTAEQVYALDPFINVFTYPEGLVEATMQDFFDGQGQEPRIDIIIEEVDDPKVKIILREQARRRRIPLIMASDLGSCVQLDILRYDQNKKLPLTYGTTDTSLRRATAHVYERPGERDAFFEFVNTLVGTAYRQDELKLILEGKCEIPTSTIIPQLGSTAAMAGAITAEAVARILLGYSSPKRVIINKRTFKVKIWN